MELKRNCPECGNEIVYKAKSYFNVATKRNSCCSNCKKKNKVTEYKRNCPTCGKEIFYKYKENLENAEANKANCSSCRAKINNSNPETKEKLREASKGENNPMFGRTYYDVIREKYGEETAKAKRKLHAENTSKATRGKKNPMYGRPSPINTGRGWSGYYKDYYFRSLLELSYIKSLLELGIKFESAEQDKYKVQYIFEGTPRNYFPDFYLIDSNEVIEIKPYWQTDREINKAKFLQANAKFNFRVVTDNEIQKISDEELVFLYKVKEIIFDKDSEKRFLNKYESMVNN